MLDANADFCVSPLLPTPATQAAIGSADAGGIRFVGPIQVAIKGGGGNGPIRFSDGTIQGVKWNDLNENGIRDADEPGLPGWTIYVDLNADGQLNLGEPNAISGADGSYAITGLSAGSYVVSEVPQSGWEQIFPKLATYPIQRVSVTNANLQGTGSSDFPSLSADGRFVAFESSSILVGDSSIQDVFVFDRLNRTIEKISNGLSGALANNASYRPSISNDGRFVAFTSFANNLVLNDTNNAEDVFVYDRQTQTTSRVSVGPSGVQANGASRLGDISGSGQFVAFQSDATNLTADTTNGFTNVFLYEIASGLTTLVSRNSAGTVGNNVSLAPSISDDGTIIAFESDSTNLVAADSNATRDIFVRNRTNGTTQRVSQSSTGVQASNSSFAAAISGNGRYVGFWSNWPSLVSPPGTPPNVFLYDLQNSTIETISIGPDNTPTGNSFSKPSISTDGRFVAFGSSTNTATPSKVYDVFVRDRLTASTRRISRSDAGIAAGGNSFNFAISDAGQTVAFGSDAKQLVPGDTNYARDVFAVSTNFPWVGGSHFVTLATSATVSGINFGNTLLDGDLSGIAWQDTNRNGNLDAGEPAISNRQIYLDTNGNSSFDTGEPNVFTGTSGDYTFGGLPAGIFSIREVLPTAWTEFSPALGRHNKTVGQLRSITFDFEDVTHNSTTFVQSGDYFREGFVLSTANGGSFQWRVYGPASVPTRPSTELEVPDSSTTQYLQRADGLPYSADSLNMRTTGASTSLLVNFIGERLDGSRVTQTLSVTATATNFSLVGFTDIVSLRWSSSTQGITAIDNVVVRTSDWEYAGLNFGSMANPSTINGKVYYDTNQNGVQDTGEIGIADRQIYLDLNGDSNFNVGEPSAKSVSDGTYRLTSNPGNYTLRQVQLANWHESQPGNGYAISIPPGASLNGWDFGNWADPSEIRGNKWNDLNANGIRETGEPGLAGWTVYIDFNNNGALDGTDVSTITQSDNPATTTVDETGNYVFAGLIPGTYSVRDLPPSGWIQTTPASMSAAVELSRSNGYTFSGFLSNPSFDQSLSKDGRYVVFTSSLALLPQDTNGFFDVYALDRQTNTLELVSISDSNAIGNSSSFDPWISDDGRYVAFQSSASNFYSGDTAGVADIFVRDRQTRTTTLATVGIAGNSNAFSLEPMLSANGRTLLFWSSATNLVPNDTNGSTDLFLRNLDTGVTTRINPNTSTPNIGDESTLGGDISADGRFVAFQSLSNDIVASDTNNFSDIFVMDRSTNTYERVSTSSNGTQANGPSEKRSISDDGRYVVFDSRATNLTADSGVTSYNVYLKDRQTGETKLISRNYNGGAANASRRPEISGDGRWITFESTSQTMFPDSSNTASDIILYDRVRNSLERLTKSNVTGGPGNQPSVNAVISRDGTAISFDSVATNLGATGAGLLTVARTPISAPLRLPVLAGQIVTAMDMGHYEKTGAISGTLFVDINGNGVQDTGEAGLTPLLGENTPSVRVYIDSNNNEAFDTGEPSTLTNSNGQYSFTQLMPGSYTVRSAVSVQRSLYQTSPSQPVGRIFGAFRVADSTSSTGFRIGFSEFNPQTGAPIRTINTTIETTQVIGAAYDGERVLILNALNGTLYQFRPDGQLVVQSVVPSSILYGVLAHLNGVTYYLEQTNSWPVLVAYDTKALQVIRRMPITHSLDGYGNSATFPSAGLGLGESADGQSLILTTADTPTSDARMLRIDPDSGRVTEYFTLDSQLPADFAATGFGGEFYVSVNQTNSIRVYNSSNALVRSYSTSPNFHFGLGGAVHSDGAARITLAPQQGNVQQSFGFRPTLGTIQGHLFEDRNNNNSQDAGEPNIVGAATYLDLNQNRKWDTGEPKTNSDSNGNYVFSNMAAGNYTVRVLPPAGLALAPTSSALRLFASRQDTIIELNPITGSTLNQFAAPAISPAAPTVAAGLAFNGIELYYVKAGVNTIFVLDPNTGATTRSFPLPAGGYDGLAEIAGKLYVLDTPADSLLEIDVASGNLLRTLNINAINPNYLGTGLSVDLLGALSESADRTKIVATGSGNRFYVIDPATGVILSNGTGGFSGGTGAAGERAATYFSPNPLDFFNSKDQKVRSITAPDQLNSLGMAVGDDEGKKVKLGLGQTLNNIDLAFRDVSRPTDIRLSVNSIFEKLTAGTTVGILTAVDANLFDSHSFQLATGVGDTDNSAFEIIGNELRSLQVFDAAVKSSYSIRVRATDASGHSFEKPLGIAVVNIPELARDIQFGDGSAQRSTITQIVIDFDGAIELSAGAFALKRRQSATDDKMQLQQIETIATTTTIANGNTRVTLTFSGKNLRPGKKALVDGNYQLEIDSSKIRTPNTTAFFDGDRNGTAGGNLLIGTKEADNFFSFFGDYDGNRLTNGLDLNRFRPAYGTRLGDAQYNAIFDFNSDGAIDDFDLGRFKVQIGSRMWFQ